MNYGQLLTFLAPETLVVLATLGVLFVDLTTLRGESARTRMQWGAWLTVVGCLAAGVALFISPQATSAGYLDGMLVISPLSQVVKAVLLLLTIGTALLSRDAKFTEHAGEYFALLLLATAGMMFLVSTENILLIFVSLELLSLCLYVLTAFNKRNVKSAEAALKYFLFGGVSAAFLLFGLSLIYGISGELNLPAIAAKLSRNPADPLLIVALVMVAIGFGFKVAAAPFHLWAPDAYEGAPTPSAAFIASGSKVASFFILTRVMIVGFAGAEGSGEWQHFGHGWVPLLAVAAALSVIIGNVAAIAQSNVKRLLAYSAIAHAGYALLGVIGGNAMGIGPVLYYAITYGVTALGAFAIVALVEESTGDCKLTDFAGLSRRSPVVAICLLVFVLSLAGLPPLAGFFGKFYVFAAALKTGPGSLGLLWLVVLAIAMSAVSLYYYLQVLKQAFIVELPDAQPIKVSATSLAVIVVLAATVVLLGCFPKLLLDSLVTGVAINTP
jgi:NADH-quinone oxidoreductase subunit N